jgi:malate synthase
MEALKTEPGIEITAPVPEPFREILTPDAVSFVAELAREFEDRRKTILENRKAVQAEIDGGNFPGFPEETREIRESEWTAAPLPEDLQDRRVEITGPVDRKMVINALNSGAKTYMADFEDSHTPTWANCLNGQINLRDAVRGDMQYQSPEGKNYQLGEMPATLLVRPRGWHLPEKHMLVDGKPVAGGIFDFGLFFFHNAHALIEKGSAPYFYLPKFESYMEARLWNDIFVKSQDRLGIENGTIKATVLIETILAAFQMNEIIYELRDHMAGLNCGRWDYIFSFIKRFKNIPAYLFPDRSQITMTRHCMHSYSLLAIQTCHRRGVHAIGGMAAQIPRKDDPEANAAAIQKVREDKIREANDGHDGTWVAHPGLVEVAMEEFAKNMPRANQIGRLREDISVTEADLLTLPDGTITEAGLRNNVSVGVRYMASWLSGTGCVPINHLMEDAATAEIARTQIWQWVHHPKARLEDGRDVNLDLFRKIREEELSNIQASVGAAAYEAGHFEQAAGLLTEIIENSELEEFLTLRAYAHID